MSDKWQGRSEEELDLVILIYWGYVLNYIVAYESYKAKGCLAYYNVFDIPVGKGRVLGYSRSQGTKLLPVVKVQT